MFYLLLGFIIIYYIVFLIKAVGWFEVDFETKKEFKQWLIPFGGWLFY
jgi:hypothetical protein